MAVAALRQLGPLSTPAVRTVGVREDATAGPAAVLNASGYVTARRRATVSSKITGRLVEVDVEEGMPVNEGQTLARLDATQYQARLELARSQLDATRRAVERTRAELRLARLTLERTRDLVGGGIAGQAELDAAETAVATTRARLEIEEAQIEVAEREVTLRRSELEDTRIRAPFDGVVVSKDAQPGEMVSPVSAGGGFTRTGICTIVDMSSLEIEVDVNESYIRRVRPGQKVEAVLDAYPDWTIPARVITPVPTADRERATVLVRIAFDESDSRILPEMGIKVSFLEARAGGEPQRPRLWVPAAALRREEDGAFVFVLHGERVERRAIREGKALGDAVEVRAGLSAGERVVVETSLPLTDGIRVRERKGPG